MAYKGHKSNELYIALAKFAAGDTARYSKKRIGYNVWFNLPKHEVEVLPVTAPGNWGSVKIYTGVYQLSSQEIVDKIEGWYERHIQVFTALSD